MAASTEKFIENWVVFMFVLRFSKLPHLAVFPKAQFANLAKTQPRIDAQAHSGGAQHSSGITELLRPPQRGLHERRSDAASAKCFHHFHIVNAGDTCAATKRCLANGLAFEARRKVPDLARPHKGHNSA